jgi:hypothetical protein
MSEDVSFERSDENRKEALLEDGIAVMIEQNPILTSQEAQLLVTSVMQDYHDWKNARSRLEKTWQECWKAYLCDVKSLYTLPDEQTTDRSRIARPVLYESVEAIFSFLMNVMLPGDEQFFTVLDQTETEPVKIICVPSCSSWVFTKNSACFSSRLL